MENKIENTEDKNVYRVQGFTCTNCAGIFEKNVKNLPGVKDAQVNFGASKITFMEGLQLRNWKRPARLKT
jgi:Cation transport ATPase